MIQFLKINPVDVRASFIALGVLTLIILSTYFAVRPKKSKEEEDEEMPLAMHFQSDPKRSTDDDFAEYVKSAAREVDVPKQNLFSYMVRNKNLLITTYQKRFEKELENVRDLTDLFSKIQREY